MAISYGCIHLSHFHNFPFFSFNYVHFFDIWAPIHHYLFWVGVTSYEFYVQNFISPIHNTTYTFTNEHFVFFLLHILKLLWLINTRNQRLSQKQTINFMDREIDSMHTSSLLWMTKYASKRLVYPKNWHVSCCSLLAFRIKWNVYLLLSCRVESWLHWVRIFTLFAKLMCPKNIWPDAFEHVICDILLTISIYSLALQMMSSKYIFCRLNLVVFSCDLQSNRFNCNSFLTNHTETN